MWVAKLKLRDDKDVYTPLTKKFKVILLGFPVSHYIEKKKVFLIAYGILQGDEKNKKGFIKELKKDKRIKRLDVKKDFLSILASHPTSRHIEVFYNPKIIHVKPIINAKDGFEYWEIAAWEKEELMKLIKVAVKGYNGTLISINQTKLEDIFLPHIMPKITQKQKQAIQLAYEYGYYSYPRKIELKELAKRMKVSFATYQEHLRKAEIKLLPFMVERIP